MSDTPTFFEIIAPQLPEKLQYVCCALSEAPSSDTPWPPITLARAGQLALNKQKSKTTAFYISTQISKPSSKHQFRNTKECFHSLHMLVLDDIGTKVDPNDLEPTYIIESSAGNFQWGYCLAEPITDRAYATKLVCAVYESSLSDGGGKMLNKFVRLPFGINGKKVGNIRNTFEVTCTEFNPDNVYTPEELLEGFGIELDPTLETANTALPHLNEEDNEELPTDTVLGWLDDHKLIQGTDGEWTQVQCPWHKRHSPGGGDTAGYSAYGQGSVKNTRVFNCFHGHCSDRSTADFLDWVETQGGPSVRVFDPVAALVERYVLLEYSSEVADTHVTAGALYPVVSLAAFRAAHRCYEMGERGGKQYHGELWLEHPQTVRCKGRVYDPSCDSIKYIADVPYFNTYRKPSHSQANGTPITFLEHIEWLIPDETECALFHDWIAQKLQKPESRSYAIVMVAALKEGEEGYRYGTGRSTVGDILAKVFQSGVSKIDLKDITGTGNSQAVYNDWADGTQLCLIEETKEEITSWREDHTSYEQLKKVIDTRMIPGVRVKPKYGKIYETDVYCNFLFFTNHENALMLPEDDRRFACISNAKGRRNIQAYAALQAFMTNTDDVATLYNWYMARNIEDFNHIYPPMTPAKAAMVAGGVSLPEEIWTNAIKLLNGDIATKQQIMKAINQSCNESGVDIVMTNKVMGMLRMKWKNMAEVYPGWRVLFDKKQVAPRIIRNHKQVIKMYTSKDIKQLQEMIKQNEELSL